MLYLQENRIYLEKSGKLWCIYFSFLQALIHHESIFWDILSAAIKLKSAEVKEKFVEYITNPNTSSSASTDTDRHISSSDKLGKPYRNVTPIFSIDEDHEPNCNYLPLLITSVAQFVCGFRH